MSVSLIKRYAEITAGRQAEIRASKSTPGKQSPSPGKARKDNITEIFKKRSRTDLRPHDDNQIDGDKT
jgi:hypothetical protein